MPNSINIITINLFSSLLHCGDGNDSGDNNASCGDDSSTVCMVSGDMT